MRLVLYANNGEILLDLDNPEAWTECPAELAEVIGEAIDMGTTYELSEKGRELVNT